MLYFNTLIQDQEIDWWLKKQESFSRPAHKPDKIASSNSRNL